MKTQRAPLIGLSLLALAACGGGSKQADTAPEQAPLPATPVAAEPAPAADAPAADAPAADAPAADAPAATENGAVCERFCARVLACTIELSKKEASDDKKQQFTNVCIAHCTEAAPEELDKARTCVDENEKDCQGLFKCLE